MPLHILSRWSLTLLKSHNFYSRYKCDMCAVRQAFDEFLRDLLDLFEALCLCRLLYCVGLVVTKDLIALHNWRLNTKILIIFNLLKFTFNIWGSSSCIFHLLKIPLVVMTINQKIPLKTREKKLISNFLLDFRILSEIKFKLNSRRKLIFCHENEDKYFSTIAQQGLLLLTF